MEAHSALGVPGHTIDIGICDPRNAFDKAFISAGQKWTLDLCQDHTDSDSQTDGEELSNPYGWKQSFGVSPRWTPGISNVRLTSKASLWENLNCSAGTNTIAATAGADPDNSTLPSVQSIASVIAVASAIALVFT
ncbi:ABC transporter [Phytophthora megakarya]|uniref:ABC transporter n=1 Tax=Phytophthora megakarya TaxID=4795 RepID=A0A225WDT6_9STRA|nr:ABC transporter [Phytophthora megakarya]